MATTTLAIISRFSYLLFTMLFSCLKLALSPFKWVLEFLLYQPFPSLLLHHHQTLREFHHIFTEEEQVQIWHPCGKEEQEVDCSVCLNKIGEGDEVRLLRCEHVFHRDCLNQWVGLMNFTCPLCRDFLGSGNWVANGRQVHVLLLKFSSFSDSHERDNWWLR